MHEHWFFRSWRPAIAWSYLAICIFDFVLFPLFISIGNVSKMIDWMPLTLKGGGLYHAAMLTVVGVTSWGRTQEKLKDIQSTLTDPCQPK